MDEERTRLLEAIFQQVAMDEELARLSKELEAIFRQVTPSRLTAPTASGCATLALYLMALRQNPKSPKIKVVKSGKDFKRDLETERREVAQMVSLARARQVRVFREEWLREQEELLEQIEQTLHNIDWILPRLSPKDSYRDPIRQIAVTAREAWEETNRGVAPPRSKNPDDPLCRFVVEAMKLIEQPCSAATVSAVLRGRRRKRRDKIDY